MNHEHETRYVRVIVDRAIYRELDYSVPENLAERVDVGSRVRVPFRDKSALATVVAIPEQSEAKGIRPIEAIIGEAPILNEQLLAQYRCFTDDRFDRPDAFRFALLGDRNDCCQRRFIPERHPHARAYAGSRG